MALEAVNCILQPVVTYLMDPVKEHIDFMTSCKKYVNDMEASMEVLNNTKLDVENHMTHNNGNQLEIPAGVPGWLKKVEAVDAEVKSISSNVGSCFSFKTRHDVGKKASKLIEVIKRLKEEHDGIVWDNLPIPPSKVDSMKASTSASSVEYHSDFKSREETFMKALEALEAGHKSHMIALCGMGGVGKTTMMKKLKTVVEEKRMFSYIVEAVIGEKTNPFAIQKAVADCLAIKDFNDISSITVRADKLRGWFKNYSEGGKKKFLIILDDIWQSVDLDDIGLSPLPDQGVDFKVLLTSRSKDVCTRMDVEADSIFDVKVLAEEEAQRFFWQFLKDSEADFREVGEDIVSKCQGLPIAIKTIAYTLKGKSKSVWDDTLTRLQHYDSIDKNLNEIFDMSYKNLEDEETKLVFLLCGLYPEDFDIPTEELVRYGRGLKLFNKVYSIKEARNRLNACIDQLVSTNLLIESNRAGCIKMHDLVLAFVLKKYSEVAHASIVNHGNISEWPANDTPDSCKRISLACNGMEEFPGDFKYPNLSFLKLTQGDNSLRFPENFYGLVEKLQVIVYEKMQYPLLPRSFEYSTNLRTLCLHECSLMFDCDSIGSLSNLEVLSFANCGIRKLPSTIGNLKKLKLLDLTGCVNLHIDDGVLKNLVNLEELYMRVAHRKAISFTDGNFNELAERSEKLSAIEIELFGNNAHPKRMSFNNLERFKISIRCFLKEEDEKTTSLENTLMLVSNKGELLESGINVLFKKTVVLHLEVDGINDLEELKCSSFNNLRVLKISECAQLRYLFTRRVAATLLNLEHLEVSLCDIMQTLIHDEDGGSESIRFPSLKFLSLDGLPKLAGLCNTGSVIELPHLMELRLEGLPNFTSIFPDDNLASSSMSSDTFTMQPFFNEEVAIPELGMLQIRRMKKLNKIWSSEVTRSESVGFSMLKTIKVEECDRLVDLFPRNPMPLLHHLKELYVKRCRSIKTIFKIDMECVTETGDGSSLVSIVVSKSENLRHVWSLKNVDSSNNNNRIIHGFESVERIQIDECVNFRNVITPITANFNLKALQQIYIDYGSVSSVESSPEQQAIHAWLKVFTPITANFNLKALQKLSMEMSSPEQQLSSVESSPEQQPEEAAVAVWSLCQYSRRIEISSCSVLSSAIPSYALAHMQNLQQLKIWKCHSMKEVFEIKRVNDVGSCSGGEGSVSLTTPPQKLPNTSSMILLPDLRNLRTLFIYYCHLLRDVFPFSTLKSLTKLEYLNIRGCIDIQVIVKKEEDGNHSTTSSSDDEVVVFPCLKSLKLRNLPNLESFFLGMNHFQWPILDSVEIKECPKMRMFTKGHSDSPKLKYLRSHIGKHNVECGLNNFFHPTTAALQQQVPYPSLDASTSLPITERMPWFYNNLINVHVHHRKDQRYIIGHNELQHMLKIEKIEISECSGVKEIFETSEMNNGLNQTHSVVEVREMVFKILDDIKCLWKSKQWTVLKFPNLTRLSIDHCDSLKHVFTISMVGSLLQLQELHISDCQKMEIIVEDVEKDDDEVRVNEEDKKEDDSDETRSPKEVEFRCLRSLTLRYLKSLKGFHLGMETIHWPSLDTLEINNCPEITTFTNGESTTPKLKLIKTSFGLFDATEGVNSFIRTKIEEGFEFEEFPMRPAYSIQRNSRSSFESEIGCSIQWYVLLKPFLNRIN